MKLISITVLLLLLPLKFTWAETFYYLCSSNNIQYSCGSDHLIKVDTKLKTITYLASIYEYWRGKNGDDADNVKIHCNATSEYQHGSQKFLNPLYGHYRSEPEYVQLDFLEIPESFRPLSLFGMTDINRFSVLLTKGFEGITRYNGHNREDKGITTNPSTQPFAKRIDDSNDDYFSYTINVHAGTCGRVYEDFESNKVSKDWEYIHKRIKEQNCSESLENYEPSSIRSCR